MREDAGSIPVYSMGVAERLTGLTARQIRYWEQQGLLKPSRTTGRHRMYSEADILRLKEVKRLLGEGMTLERVKVYFANRESRRLHASGEFGSSRLVDRIPPRVGSLYGGANRAELERLIDRKIGK